MPTLFNDSISIRRCLFAYKIPIILVVIFVLIIVLSGSVEEKPLDPRYEVLNNLPFCQLDHDKNGEFRINVPKLSNDFGHCIRPIVEKWRNNTQVMNVTLMETEACDNVFRELEITPIENTDETKWVILPTCKEDNVLVSLGIGQDTMAEENLHRLLPNTKFYGADPVIYPNKDLYSKFGKFFPFAIGRKPGFSTSWVLEKWYHYEEVTTIPFTYFLSDILGLKKIDMAWIDIEGGELEFLDQLHRGEELDRKGVTICQFNIEIHFAHVSSRANAFHDFIFRVLEEKRYVFLKPSRPTMRVHRLFFVNVENKECLRKFLLRSHLLRVE